MFLRCPVQKPKEKQGCCGARCKHLRKSNVVAVPGAKTEGKAMFVRCLVQKPNLGVVGAPKKAWGADVNGGGDE